MIYSLPTIESLNVLNDLIQTEIKGSNFAAFLSFCVPHFEEIIEEWKALLEDRKGYCTVEFHEGVERLFMDSNLLENKELALFAKWFAQSGVSCCSDEQSLDFSFYISLDKDTNGKKRYIAKRAYTVFNTIFKA